MLLSSAYGFNREDAKTSDYFFTGFPSYWNIVVFYLFVMRLTQQVNAIVLLALAALVFVPIRYLYPTRTPKWRGSHAGARVRVGRRDARDAVAAAGRLAGALVGSLVFPVYYVILSLAIGRASSRT